MRKKTRIDWDQLAIRQANAVAKKCHFEIEALAPAEIVSIWAIAGLPLIPISGPAGNSVGAQLGAQIPTSKAEPLMEEINTLSKGFWAAYVREPETTLKLLVELNAQIVEVWKNGRKSPRNVPDWFAVAAAMSLCGPHASVDEVLHKAAEGKGLSPARKEDNYGSRLACLSTARKRLPLKE